MRHANCFFCDDIRSEVGGKISLMGIYHGDLLVSQQPTVLPKLCISVNAATTPDKPFSTLAVRVASKDKVYLEQEMPPEIVAQIQSNVQASADPDDPYYRIALGMNVAIAPFIVDTACTLKTTVIADGEEIPAGRLRIGFAASWPPAT